MSDSRLDEASTRRLTQTGVPAQRLMTGTARITERFEAETPSLDRMWQIGGRRTPSNFMENRQSFELAITVTILTRRKSDGRYGIAPFRPVPAGLTAISIGRNRAALLWATPL
jgi:hypothetical protein